MNLDDLSEEDKEKLQKYCNEKKKTFVEGCTDNFKSGVAVGCWIGGAVLVVGIATAAVGFIQPRRS